MFHRGVLQDMQRSSSHWGYEEINHVPACSCARADTHFNSRTCGCYPHLYRNICQPTTIQISHVLRWVQLQRCRYSPDSAFFTPFASICAVPRKQGIPKPQTFDFPCSEQDTTRTPKPLALVGDAAVVGCDGSAVQTFEGWWSCSGDHFQAP